MQLQCCAVMGGCMPLTPRSPWGGPWGCTQPPHTCQHIAADCCQEHMHDHCKPATIQLISQTDNTIQQKFLVYTVLRELPSMH